MAKTTERPWSYRETFCNGEPTGWLVNTDGRRWFDIGNEQDAALIVRAVNAHDKLLAALQEISEIADHYCESPPTDISEEAFIDLTSTLGDIARSWRTRP